MWVKICGNTTWADAQAAVDAGADAVGFVFAPSKRRVTVEVAGKIVSELVGEAERVGIFQDEELSLIQDAVRLAKLTGVQMHGEARLETLRALRDTFGKGLILTQTLHWAVDDGLAGGTITERLIREMRELRGEGVVDRILVDAQAGAALGGTGRRFNWEEGRQVFAAGGLPIIAAGGLTPHNVAEAIVQMMPWGVDVASGVEKSPGRKDYELVRRFVAAARRTVAA